MSEFADWFGEQFGPRERGLLKDRSDDELFEARDLGRAAEQELMRREIWDQQHRAAMYARNNWADPAGEEQASDK